MLSAAGIAQALGGRREGVHFMARCPAHADRSPSLAIREGPNGVLVHCHAGCSQAAVIAALKARGLWETYTPIARSLTSPPPRRPVLPELAKKYGSTGNQEGSCRGSEQRSETVDNPNLGRASDIWCAAVDPRGTPAEGYLKSRELELPDDPARVLRYHPRCPWPRGGTMPCLVALFTSIEGDEPRAIHRIAFELETYAGQGKAMLGPVGGCAVKLDADEDVTYGLNIAEGIETALARRMKGHRPIWALGSAGAIERFPVLPGIEALTVWADNDASMTGLRVAQACVNRWAAAGREAHGEMPTGIGVDWADEQGAR